MNDVAPGAITGIGSVPFRDLAQAAAFSLAHDVPFLPQCLQLDAGEGMLSQALETPFRSVTLAPWFEAVQKHPSRVLKVQIAGPSVVRRFGSPALSVEQRQQRVLENALALGRAVESAGRVPLVVLDEPNLDADDLGPVLALVRRLRASGAHVGIHNCGSFAPGVLEALLESELQWLSFDVALALDEVSSAPGLRAFFERAGRLCLGFTMPDGVAAEALAPQIPRRLPVEQLMFSASCGLGLATPLQALRTIEVLGRLRSLSARV